MSTFASFTENLSPASGAYLIGYTAPTGGGEFRTPIFSLLAQSRSLVAMPTGTASTGSLGQIACNGTGFGIYVGLPNNINWVFWDIYRV